MSTKAITKAVAYGLGVAFVIGMGALTYAILSGPNVRTEYVSYGNSHTWAIFTIILAAFAIFIIGFAASEER